MERSKQLAAMVLVGAFAVGLALGLTWQSTAGALPAGRSRATVAAATAGAGGALDAFAAELVLSAAQRAAVDSILDERHRIIDSIVAPMRPQIEAARESARAQIRTRLSDEQRRRYDVYLARMRQLEAKDHSGGRE